FSSSAVDHRDLHSFPTRRSSDLELSVEQAPLGVELLVGPGDGELVPHETRARETEDLAQVGLRPHGAELAGARADHGDGLVRQRSEEHTSELQSQSNLVCRLLLE